MKEEKTIKEGGKKSFGFPCCDCEHKFAHDSFCKDCKIIVTGWEKSKEIL